MTEQELIQAIRDAGAQSTQAILDVLCDGDALMALGVTDEDQGAVEGAFNELNSR